MQTANKPTPIIEKACNLAIDGVDDDDDHGIQNTGQEEHKTPSGGGDINLGLEVVFKPEEPQHHEKGQAEEDQDDRGRDTVFLVEAFGLRVAWFPTPSHWVGANRSVVLSSRLLKFHLT